MSLRWIRWIVGACSKFASVCHQASGQHLWSAVGRLEAKQIISEADALLEASDQRAPAGAPNAPGSVALLVRSYAEDSKVLKLLLKSAALFWPRNWEVIVVLDSENPADHQLAKELPLWVRVEFEDKPLFYESYIPLRKQTSTGLRSTAGYTRGQFSAFIADVYTSAEFIAVADSDIVFITPAMHLTLFRDSQPLVMGFCGLKDAAMQYSFATDALRIPQFAQFMFSLPFVIRRHDIIALRHYIIDTMQSTDLADLPAPFPPPPQRAKLAAETGQMKGIVGFFAEAYVDLQSAIARRAWQVYENDTFGFASGQLLPSFQAIAGSFLWEFQRDSYAWSLRGCNAKATMRCAALCPASHYAMHMYNLPKAHPHTLHLGEIAIERAKCAFGDAQETVKNRSGCSRRAREQWALDLLQCSEVGTPEAEWRGAEHLETLHPARSSPCNRYGAAALLAEQRMFMRSRCSDCWRALD